MTIKAYTDLPQSKILAEILPLESADMYYVLSEDESTNMISFGKSQGFFDKTQVAWSLAALLTALSFPNLFENDGWNLYTTIDEKLFSINNADNPVDACYEIIIRLHELNLL